MFPRTESTQKKQQPIAKDESVRKENQLEEDQNSVQPMGNEAANVELMNQMLREANDDNELDLSGYEDQEVVERPLTDRWKLGPTVCIGLSFLSFVYLFYFLKMNL